MPITTIRFAAKTFPHLCLLVNNASLFLSDNLEDAEFKRFSPQFTAGTVWLGSKALGEVVGSAGSPGCPGSSPDG